jgi:hypothetical protein
VVDVAVPGILPAQAAGHDRFEVEAATVGEALRALPVADLLLDEHVELVGLLHVYVDGFDHRERGGWESSIAGVREIRVVGMVSGG